MKMMEKEGRVMKLTGKDAEEFEKYDSSPPTPEEIASLEKAKAVYLKYGKNE